MKRFWMGLSVFSISIAGVALWLGDFEGAFFIATIGALAWFLNYRARVRETIDDANESDENFSSNDED